MVRRAGVAALINEICHAQIEPGMQQPPILLLSPPPIRIPNGPLSHIRRRRIPLRRPRGRTREVAASLNCAFFDAGTVVTASPLDGVQLDANRYLILGQSIADTVTAAMIPA